MPQWIWLIAVVIGYLVLTQWLLPKLGVPTWRTSGCAESRRDKAEEGNPPLKPVSTDKKR